MTPRRIVLPAVLALAAWAVFATSSASTPRFQDHEELEAVMDDMRSELKSAGKGIDAKDQEAAWKSICSFQEKVLAAKQLMPEKASSVAAEERPAFVNAFRTRLAMLLKASCDAESAVLAGKFDEADRVVKEVIWPMQKPAHKEFRND
ncbi:MAG: cytochrome b562 [Planctomycetota bacterium]